MKIGIISDSHDNIEALNKALKLLEKEKIKALIHCGDLCAPFMIDKLAKFKGETHVIAGNTCDRRGATVRALDNGIEFHGDFADIEIEDRKIAIVHEPELAEGLAATQKFDAVFYGHDHTANAKRIGKTLLVNPGDLMGWKHKSSYAVYDTDDNTIKHFELR